MPVALYKRIFKRLSHRKARPTNVLDDPVLRTSSPDPLRASDEIRSRQTPPPVEDASKGPPTASNALKFSLKALSIAASNIPFGGALSSVIDPLLYTMDRLDLVSTNTQEVVELAARIKLLTPIVDEMSKNPSEKGRGIVEAIERELQSITNDLNDARSQGRLGKFFNSVDNASSLNKHNAALAQLIADSTLATVHEVLSSLHDLESKLQQPGAEGSQAHIEIVDVTGGFGGTGGDGLIGGTGGEGDGPVLDITSNESLSIRRVSGGTGGTGGRGIEVGGTGGTGKAPVLIISRRSQPSSSDYRLGWS